MVIKCFNKKKGKIKILASYLALGFFNTFYQLILKKLKWGMFILYTVYNKRIYD